MKLCKAGKHPMNAKNTYEHPTKGKECRGCKREYMREFMRTKRRKAKQAAAKAAKAKAVRR